MKVLLVALSVLLATFGHNSVLAEEKSEVPPSNRTSASSSCVSFDGHTGVVEIRNNKVDRSLIVLDGITFQSKVKLSESESDVLWIGGYGFGKGARLSFPDTGVELLLPRPATSVTLQLIQGNTPITGQSIDNRGNILETKTTNFDETTPKSIGMVHFNQIDFSISKIELLRGGDEGGIVFICAVMKS